MRSTIERTVQPNQESTEYSQYVHDTIVVRCVHSHFDTYPLAAMRPVRQLGVILYSQTQITSLCLITSRYN